MNLMKQLTKQQFTRTEITYIGCLLGSAVKRDSKISSLVLKIVIFLLVEERCLCVSGPEGGKEFFPLIIPLISSPSFDASLNSRIHDADGVVIAP